MTEKNAKKERAKKNRVMATFNTGTRTMKSKKYLSRQKLKKGVDKEEYQCYNKGTVREREVIKNEKSKWC